ncbi:hypothetical protein Tco_1279735 [Tanacetum coccineum]
MGQPEVGAQAQNDLPLYSRSTVASTVQCKMWWWQWRNDGDGGEVVMIAAVVVTWVFGWGGEVVVVTGGVVEVRLWKVAAAYRVGHEVMSWWRDGDVVVMTWRWR